MKPSTLTSNGRIVIPIEIRKNLGLLKSTGVRIYEKSGQIVITPLTRKYIRGLAGIMSSESKVLNVLLENRKEDKSKGK